jgi:predicted dehydrogenase
LTATNSPGGLRVVVVGAGRMGREQARAVTAAGDQVIAFVDPDVARAETAAAELAGEGVSVGTNVVGVLESPIGEQASAVVIASPSALHLAHTQAALAYGLPVLLEKPPWVPGQDAGPLLTARRDGAVIAVGMSTRFNPGIQAVRQAVRSGSLGQVFLLSDRVAFTLAPGDLAEWYFDVQRSGGGVLVTNGVHSLDRVAWILGEALVLRSARLSSRLLTSCEDTAVLDLSAGGVPVHVTELWGPGPVPPSELTVIGSHGTCWTDAEGNWRLSSHDSSASGGRPTGYSELAAQWLSFRALVLEGRGDDTMPQVDELKPTMELLAQVLDR